MLKICGVCSGSGIVKRFRVCSEERDDDVNIVKDWEDCPNCKRGIVVVPIEQALIELNDLVNEFSNASPHGDTHALIDAYKKEIQEWIGRVDTMLRW